MAIDVSFCSNHLFSAHVLVSYCSPVHYQETEASNNKHLLTVSVDKKFERNSAAWF